MKRGKNGLKRVPSPSAAVGGEPLATESKRTHYKSIAAFQHTQITRPHVARMTKGWLTTGPAMKPRTKMRSYRMDLWAMGMLTRQA